MGVEKVKVPVNQKHLSIFVNHLLKDIRAFDKMLDEGWFDRDNTIRIGAEQELCLIDKNFRPAPLNMEVLAKANNPLFTTEFARFTLEINLTPHEFKGKCLSEMEKELNELIEKLRKTAQSLGSDIIMTGILPTIRKFDIEVENITPVQRYYALYESINKLRGGAYDLKISGIDELIIRHDSPLLEACNTGFQVHLQITAKDFVKMYNIAQAISGPVLAASVNSPILFGKRLWKETRTALFQQSIDTRCVSDHLREMSPRVTFGNNWVKNSILEIFKEDIVRYRVLLSSEITEDVFQKIESGEAPALMALQVHNSTVYRWNRPCYGISDGITHIRIENRIFPSGPTIIDEIANAAFWLGLMEGYKNEINDVTKLMDFDDAKSNFLAAAQMGLDTNLIWFNNRNVNGATLILDELLPIARNGLKSKGISNNDISRYLDVIEQRVSSGITGSQWMLKSFSNLSKKATKNEVLTIITSSIVNQQKQNIPVHQWKLPQFEKEIEEAPGLLLVEEFMDTDLFTVQPNDILALVSEMMNWQNINNVPVENNKGILSGLVTSRILIKYISKNIDNKSNESLTVKSVMESDPITIKPDATIMEAMELMEKHNVDCLPVVKGKKLVGLVNEQTFLNITKTLLNRFTKKNRK